MSTLVTRIGPADHGRAMTLEEFQDAEEEYGYRSELARGVGIVHLLPPFQRGDIDLSKPDCESRRANSDRLPLLLLRVGCYWVRLVPSNPQNALNKTFLASWTKRCVRLAPPGVAPVGIKVGISLSASCY